MCIYNIYIHYTCQYTINIQRTVSFCSILKTFLLQRCMFCSPAEPNGCNPGVHQVVCYDYSVKQKLWNHRDLICFNSKQKTKNNTIQHQSGGYHWICSHLLISIPTNQNGTFQGTVTYPTKREVRNIIFSLREYAMSVRSQEGTFFFGTNIPKCSMGMAYFPTCCLNLW